MTVLCEERALLNAALPLIDRFGHVVQTLSDASTNSNLFDGPWAAAVNDKGNTAQVFVSNVEGGTVTRRSPSAAIDQPALFTQFNERDISDVGQEARRARFLVDPSSGPFAGSSSEAAPQLAQTSGSLG